MMNIQNFRRRDRVEPTLPPAVDLDGLEATLRAGQELAAVASFGELPAKEIDDAIFALKEELAEIEADAQRVRNAYVEVTDRLMRHVERQKAVHRIARSAFAAMRDQCAALGQGELPFPAPAATAESSEGTPEQGAA